MASDSDRMAPPQPAYWDSDEVPTIGRPFEKDPMAIIAAVGCIRINNERKHMNFLSRKLIAAPGYFRIKQRTEAYTFSF